MKDRDASHVRRQRLSIVHGILCVVLILVSMQLWLLTATMNAYLAGHLAIVWPAAAASAAWPLSGASDFAARARAVAR